MFYFIFIALLNIDKISGYGNNELSGRPHITRDELAEFIRALNNDENHLNELTPENLEYKDLDENTKEKHLQEILWLLKKSYDAHKYEEIEPVHSGVRLYFLKNPEVLDEYKSYLKRKKESSSRYNDHEARILNLKGVLSELRNREDMLNTLRRSPRISRLTNDHGFKNIYARDLGSDKETGRDRHESDWKIRDNKDDWERNEGKKDWNEDTYAGKNNWNVREKSYEIKEKEIKKPYNEDYGDVNNLPKRVNDWSVKKQEYRDDFGDQRDYGRHDKQKPRYLQGRTPIPMVGKRYVYDKDK